MQLISIIPFETTHTCKLEREEGRTIESRLNIEGKRGRPIVSAARDYQSSTRCRQTRSDGVIRAGDLTGQFRDAVVRDYVKWDGRIAFCAETNMRGHTIKRSDNADGACQASDQSSSTSGSARYIWT
jgi:hypothetical protein